LSGLFLYNTSFAINSTNNGFLPVNFTTITDVVYDNWPYLDFTNQLSGTIGFAPNSDLIRKLGGNYSIILSNLTDWTFADVTYVPKNFSNYIFIGI